MNCTRNVRLDPITVILQGSLGKIMVLTLDGNSEHTADVYSKTVLFNKKLFRFFIALNLNKCLTQIR